MSDWIDYRHFSRLHPQLGAREHSFIGDILIWPAFASPQLDNRRNITVLLPDSYSRSSRRYPVLYMHDGQNLFDDATSFAGEWHVDETLALLGAEGLEAIVVGIDNAGPERLDEYSPFVDEGLGGGKGDAYVSFLADTLKLQIDADFRTLPQRQFTGIMGSSMGGLISLYAFFARRDTFAFAGVMSPSVGFAEEALLDFIDRVDHVPGKIYLDAGTRELGGSPQFRGARARSRRYYARVRRLQRLLYKTGYRPQRDMLYVEEKWAHHQEAAWARRLPQALRFWLVQTMEGGSTAAAEVPTVSSEALLAAETPSEQPPGLQS